MCNAVEPCSRSSHDKSRPHVAHAWAPSCREHDSHRGAHDEVMIDCNEHEGGCCNTARRHVIANDCDTRARRHHGRVPSSRARHHAASCEPVVVPCTTRVLHDSIEHEGGSSGSKCRSCGSCIEASRRRCRGCMSVREADCEDDGLLCRFYSCNVCLDTPLAQAPAPDSDAQKTRRRPTSKKHKSGFAR